MAPIRRSRQRSCRTGLPAGADGAAGRDVPRSSRLSIPRQPLCLKGELLRSRASGRPGRATADGHPFQRRPRVRPARGGLTNCSSSAAGGSAVPGPPAAAQASRSSVQPSSVAKPTQVGRPPPRRPADEGCTTTTFAWSQGPRQSVVRTMNRPPDSSAPARSRASCRAWSMSGNLRASPQQHPRQTTRVHGRERAAPTATVRGSPRGESTGTRGGLSREGANGPARDRSRAGPAAVRTCRPRPPTATVRDVSAAHRTGSGCGALSPSGPRPRGVRRSGRSR